MLMFLHQLSGIVFYILGLSFFVAWVMMKNAIAPVPAAVWMQIGDLPLAFSAIVYGGLSLYRSVRPASGSVPTMLPWIIGVPLAVFFALLLVINFWPR